MGIQYLRTSSRIDGKAFIAMGKQVQNIIEDELTPVGEEGAAEARKKVDAARTGASWTKGPQGMGMNSGWFEGDTGDRVDTGDMRDGLGYRIVRGIGVGLDVGWTELWMEYFKYQDEGFTRGGLRRLSPRKVEGMGVMAHLETFVRDRSDEAFDRAMKRISDGL